jgi:hypothetical protein
MGNSELLHDTAMMMAHAILDTMRPSLDKEQRLSAFFKFYTACKAGLEGYEIMNTRLMMRLSPTNN